MLDVVRAWFAAWAEWFGANWPRDWSGAVGFLESMGAWALTDPIVRTLSLATLIYLTLRLIAGVYGGNVQNSLVGPVGLRPHVAKRLKRSDIRIPKSMLAANVDGIHADFEIVFAYADSRGRQRTRTLARIRNGMIHQPAGRLPSVADRKFGHELPPEIRSLLFRDVVLPDPDFSAVPKDVVAITPDMVGEYVDTYKLEENWTPDDDAPLVSISAELLTEVANERVDFIVNKAALHAMKRDGKFAEKLKPKVWSADRPGVFGSYYLRFNMSRDPLFVLTRHPDRDLKMTAWLTVLTSLFAMAMEAWPLRLDQPFRAATEMAQPLDQVAKPRGLAQQ
jgi:hypothetical protein